MEISTQTDDTYGAGEPETLRIRSGIRLLLPVVLGTVLAFVFFCRAFSDKQTNFADAALGKFTTPFYAKRDGFPIHTVEYEDEYVEGWKQRGSKPVVLWLGNSQLHGVNEYQEGQETVAPRFSRRLAHRGYDTLVVSPASATPEEQYILFEHVQSNVKLRYVAIGMVFVNWRLHQVRDSVQSSLNDEKVSTALSHTESGKSLLKRFKVQGESEEGLGALNETVQEGTERFINTWLEENTSLWPARHQARGQIRLGVRTIRNTIFGVGIHTKRPMVQGNYQRHINAVHAICARCVTAGIPMLLYIAPTRQDYELPVVQPEYDAFKRDIQKIADQYKATYADFEKIVPSEFFGRHDSSNLFQPEGVDFWHFKEAGHELLESAVGSRIEADLTGNNE